MWDIAWVWNLTIFGIHRYTLITITPVLCWGFRKKLSNSWAWWKLKKYRLLLPSTWLSFVQDGWVWRPHIWRYGWCMFQKTKRMFVHHFDGCRITALIAPPHWLCFAMFIPLRFFFCEVSYEQASKPVPFWVLNCEYVGPIAWSTVARNVHPTKTNMEPTNLTFLFVEGILRFHF